MLMLELIEKKKHGKSLTKDEFNFIINNYLNGNIPDYQISAFLMAVYFQGLNKKETFYLTESMLNSGDKLSFDNIDGIFCDKHSTGGVGDKTSLALLPLVAASGIIVAKMSGRGLGHTGGTLDKLESIPGFKIDISEEQFLNQVKDINLAIVGQTKNLVPADKSLYALRDVTGTVDSLPLIAASIMSKKLASGAHHILLDVKYGSGAFMKNKKDAKKLASLMVEIGDHFKRDTVAILSPMEQPLGLAIGNIIEVEEAVNTLKGKGPIDFTSLCLSLGSVMLMQANIVSSIEDGEKLLKEKINDGSGFNKLKEMVSYQGGDVSYLDDLSKFQKAKYQIPIYASKTGFISDIDALKIGEAAMLLGAGRAKKEDSIDFTAGIKLLKKVNDVATEGDIIAYLYTNKEDYLDAKALVNSAFKYQSSSTLSNHNLEIVYVTSSQHR